MTAVGKGSGSVATFDMSAGGNNYFVAADDAGASSGSISYTGGSGDDSLTFGKNLASQGNATFDMRAGGNNTLVVEDSATAAFWTAHGSSGSLSYTGGAGNDNITINGAGLGVGGTATFDMSAGGNNTFVTGDSAASSNISFVYTGGSGTDSLTLELTLRIAALRCLICLQAGTTSSSLETMWVKTGHLDTQVVLVTRV